MQAIDSVVSCWFKSRGLAWIQGIVDSMTSAMWHEFTSLGVGDSDRNSINQSICVSAKV